MMDLKQWAEKTRLEAERKRVIAKAAKVRGKPWWDSDTKQFVCTYQSLDQLNAELPLAAEKGWYIEDQSSTEGHINVGRTATRVALTGGIGLLFGASRSKGKVTVTWRRE